MVSLSAQQIVDCSASAGNSGCSGGSLRITLRYLQASRGLMRNVDYPYESEASTLSRSQDKWFRILD